MSYDLLQPFKIIISCRYLHLPFFFLSAKLELPPNIKIYFRNLNRPQFKTNTFQAESMRHNLQAVDTHTPWHTVPLKFPLKMFKRNIERCVTRSVGWLCLDGEPEEGTPSRANACYI